jgi:peptidoglycan/LPS O-acetylase OafA/YrhL
MVKYRPDVDGLRTLAVVPVVLYHAQLGFMSGGYVGVDIFFVISGFLITLLILTEMETGRFSIAQFYQRRIIRIFPAFLVVMLFTTCALWSLGFNADADIRPQKVEYNASFGWVSRLLDPISRRNANVKLIDLSNALCGQLACPVVDQGRPLYFDSNHLTTHGARLVSGELDRIFQ